MKKRGAEESSRFLEALALERTKMAIERNTLSYIRTAFSAFILGFALIEFFQNSIFYVYLGFASLFIGFVFILFGAFWYSVRKKRIMGHI